MTVWRDKRRGGWVAAAATLYESGMSLKAVGTELATPKITVYEALIEAGVQMRRRGQYPRRAPRPAPEPSGLLGRCVPVLYQGVPEHWARIDADDFALISAFRWRMSGKGYAITSEKIGGRWTGTLLHRKILGLGHGDPRQGDHRNFDKLDNRRQNLRIVSGVANRQHRTDPSTWNRAV